MPIKRITISVPEEVAERIKRAAGERAVSTWVTELVQEHLEEELLLQQWEEFYREVNPSAADKRRARAMYRRLTRGRGKGEDAA